MQCTSATLSIKHFEKFLHYLNSSRDREAMMIECEGIDQTAMHLDFGMPALF